jgi:hypothetical protein
MEEEETKEPSCDSPLIVSLRALASLSSAIIVEVAEYRYFLVPAPEDIYDISVTFPMPLT